MAVKKRNYLTDIRALQIARVVAFFAGAVALVALLHDKTVAVNALLTTKDSLTSQTQTVFVPGLKNWLDAPIAYMAASALVVSGTVALHRVTRGELSYQKELKSGSSSLKWIDIGVSSAIIIEIVALLAGVTDPGTVKMCAGAILVTAALGWLADHQQTLTKKPAWSAFRISLASGILPWIAIVSSLLFTAVYGMIRLPWYSYALAGAMLVGFCLLATNQFLSIRNKKAGAWKQDAFSERNYLVIDVATKAAFVGILLLGLKG